MAAQEYPIIGLAPALNPLIPVRDDGSASSAVLNETLSRGLTFTEELRVIAHRHRKDAPLSSQHAFALAAALSRLILNWIEDWPA